MLQISNLRKDLIEQSSRLICNNSIEVFFSFNKEVLVVFARKAFLRSTSNIDINNKEDSRIDNKTFANNNCKKNK